MTSHFIFAPHVDDEAIGCFQLLRQADHCLVIYCEKPTKQRRKEADAAAKAFSFGYVFADDEPLEDVIHGTISTMSEEAICWAPDPHWELHPLHKIVSSLVYVNCLRYDIRFGTYTTNMNTPYLRQLTAQESYEKCETLNKIYPSQAGLWETDHKYFLFEGRVEWNPPVD